MRAHLRLGSSVDLCRHIEEASIFPHYRGVRAETARERLRVGDQWLVRADDLLLGRRGSVRVRLLHRLRHDLKLLLLRAWVVRLCSGHGRRLWLSKLRCAEVLEHLTGVVHQRACLITSQPDLRVALVLPRHRRALLPRLDWRRRGVGPSIPIVLLLLMVLVQERALDDICEAHLIMSVHLLLAFKLHPRLPLLK